MNHDGCEGCSECTTLYVICEFCAGAIEADEPRIEADGLIFCSDKCKIEHAEG
jgi:hypothetical protein